MKYKSLIFLSLLGFLLLFGVDAEAQNKYKKRKSKSKAISSYRGGSVGGKFRPYSWVGASINALNYYGDMAPLNRAASTDISFTRPGFGVTYSYKYHQYLGLKANLNWGLLRGDDVTADFTSTEDAARYHRNLSFRNNIWELNGGFDIYLIPEYNGPNFRNTINVYIFLGVGIFSHNPKGLVPDYDYQTYGPDAAANGSPGLPQAGEWVSLRDLGTEGQNNPDGPDVYSRIEFNIPVAIGVILRLPGNWNAGLEIGYRHTFTDYLDDVSGSYADYSSFDNDLSRIMADRSGEPVAVVSGENRALGNQVVQRNGEYWSHSALGAGREGSVRGNPDNDDVYLMTQIKLTYIIPKGKVRRRAKFR